VRVVPATDELRRVLKHPNGMAFRSSGSVEWPLDKFTQRRIADGSVKVEDKAEANKPADKPHGGKPHPAAPAAHQP
jgi:hypothetical protein